MQSPRVRTEQVSRGEEGKWKAWTSPRTLSGGQPDVEWKDVSLQSGDSCTLESRLGVSLSWQNSEEAASGAVAPDRSGEDRPSPDASGKGPRRRQVWK